MAWRQKRPSWQKHILPAGHSSREWAFYYTLQTAIDSRQPDATIARAADDVAAEMVDPQEGPDYLSGSYSAAATLLQLSGRRGLSLEYARRGLETSRSPGAASTCGAGAAGVLAGEAYRQFQKTEGDRLHAFYVEALRGRTCAFAVAPEDVFSGFNAMADGFMKMSPDAGSVRSMIALALEVDEKSRR